MRAARLSIAVAITGGRQHGLVGGDGKRACKLGDRKIPPRGDFDGEVLQSVVPGIEERLHRYSRLVVKQDDQLFADMDKRDLLIGDRREVDLDLLVVSEVDDDRLISQRLGQLEDPWWRAAVGNSRAGSLRNLELSVHKMSPTPHGLESIF